MRHTTCARGDALLMLGLKLRGDTGDASSEECEALGPPRPCGGGDGGPALSAIILAISAAALLVRTVSGLRKGRHQPQKAPHSQPSGTRKRADRCKSIGFSPTDITLQSNNPLQQG